MNLVQPEVLGERELRVAAEVQHGLGQRAGVVKNPPREAQLEQAVLVILLVRRVEVFVFAARPCSRPAPSPAEA